MSDLEAALDCAGWNALGYTFVQIGRFDEALRAYHRGIERSEQEVNEGSTRMGRMQEGPAAFKNALDISPNDALAYLRLGQPELHEGHVREGLALIKRSTECEPGNFEYMLEYVRASYAAGDAAFEPAFEEFLKGKSNDPAFLVPVAASSKRRSPRYCFAVLRLRP
jgi:tetratricopeptide (TPR) repeat protein